jgi:hypothetical protein
MDDILGPRGGIFFQLFLFFNLQCFSSGVRTLDLATLTHFCFPTTVLLKFSGKTRPGPRQQYTGTSPNFLGGRIRTCSHAFSGPKCPLQ